MRLAELVGSLSLATDLGADQPLETAISCTLAALALARAHGLGAAHDEAVFWSGLLRFAGCTSTSVEEASFSGDDLDLRAVLLPADFHDPGDLPARLQKGFAAALDGEARQRAVVDFATRGPEIAPAVLTAHCEVAVRLARRLGLPAAVVESLDAYHERWDGKGPRGLAEEAISPAARLLAAGQAAVTNARALDLEELDALLGRRAGGALDPALAATLRKELRGVLAAARGGSPWEQLMAREPAPHRTVAPEEVRRVAEVLADHADVKSPYTLGHTRGVAELAASAARALSLPAAEIAELEIAAHLHDAGRAAVPNGIWDKRGPLGPVERERMRRHAYETERIFAHAPALAAAGKLAASDHERLDGSGYTRGSAESALSAGARILAAADVYHAMREDRPHRPAHSAERAAQLLGEEVAAGKLDARAAAAVLEAAGHTQRRPTWPAGLTDREVDVLRLVARGLTNKEVGNTLGISPRTVQQHTLHVYAKLGVTTRAAAALFAAEHTLFEVWAR